MMTAESILSKRPVQNCKVLYCLAHNADDSCQFCTALHTLLMMTAESMLSKRPVLRNTAVLFFLLKLFSSHIYCIKINLGSFLKKCHRLLAPEVSRIKQYKRVALFRKIQNKNKKNKDIIDTFMVL